MFYPYDEYVYEYLIHTHQIIKITMMKKKKIVIVYHFIHKHFTIEINLFLYQVITNQITYALF